MQHMYNLNGGLVPGSSTQLIRPSRNMDSTVSGAPRMMAGRP